MQIVVKILTAILPYILGYLDKHSDDILSRVYKWIEDKLGGKTVATVRFNVINESGETVKSSLADFNIDIFGSVIKKSVNDIITITGFKEGKQKFIIKAEGYLDNEVEITFDSDDSVVETTIVMHKEK